MTIAHGATGNGPTWFEVKLKNGLIYEYGGTTDSRALLPGTSTPYAWALSKVRDRLGNNMVIAYSGSSGARIPSTIQYTQAPVVSSTYPYAVVFSYNTRDADDRTTGYIAGSQFSVNSQLTLVDIRQGGISGTLLRRYRLNYSDSPTTGRSRLSSFQECAGSSGLDCRAATTINYQNGQSGVAAPTTLASVGENSMDHVMPGDFNGDGRSDLAYAIFAEDFTSATVYVRFSSSSGLLAPSNTGIVLTGLNLGGMGHFLVDDFVGAGSTQILAPIGSVWHVYRWNGSTFVATSTGLQVDANRLASLYPSFASADVNGDGLPDMVWGATYGGIRSVYTRLNTASGGSLSFSPTMTQAFPVNDDWMGVFGNHSSALSDVQHMDFNGDGREDIILATAVFASGQYHARELISQGSTFATGPAVNPSAAALSVISPVAAHWNDDSCTDLYFSNAVYLSACNGSAGQLISMTEFGGALLDWNADGRTDVLSFTSGGIKNIILSQGTSASSPAPTSITAPYLMVLDIDGDGLSDLASFDGFNHQLKYGFHLGAATPPDLVNSITDGFSNSFSPTYKTITQSNYTLAYSGVPAASFPDVNYTAPLYVVNQFSASDGRGGTYQTQFHYWAARKNLRGRGFKGFGARRAIDGRNNLRHYTEYRLDFPFTGQVAAERLRQPNDTTLVRSVVNVYSKTVLDAAVNNRREFVFLDQTTLDIREAGGLSNGAQVLTRTTDNSFDNWGTLIAQTTETREIGTGLNPNATHTAEMSAMSVVNDTANWCLSRPGQVTHTNQHTLPGGAPLTRTTALSWNYVACRLTEETIEPGSAQLQVETSYDFDGVGNPTLVTVIPAAGQGQITRETQINWGTDGRAPRMITNPVGHITQLRWDFDSGTTACPAAPLALGTLRCVVDANSLVTLFDVDTFGRLTRTLRPDGTTTTYDFAACNAANGFCGLASDVRASVQVTARKTDNSAIRTDTQYFDAAERLRYTYEQILGGAESGVIVSYDSLGRIASQSTPFLSGDPVWYTTYGYDLLGRVTLVQRQASESDASTSVTQIAYQGLKTVATDPLNHSHTQIRNAIGEVIQTLDAANSDTEYEYDAFGNLLKARDFYGNATTLTYNVRGMKMTSSDPDMGNWTYNYYPLGELKTQTNAKSQTVTFTYDRLSRPETRVESEGTTTWTWDTAANAVGQLRSVASPGTYSETYSYDNRSRLVQTDVLADGVHYFVNQGYNSATGLLETLTYPTSTAGVRFKVRYDYQYGLLQSVRSYTNDVLGTVFWQANANNARGQIIDEQLGNGLKTISGYDRISGLLDDRITGPGGGSTRQNFEFRWDKVGNLTRRQEFNINNLETFNYDALNRLDYSQLDGVTNLDLTYDAIGNITWKSDVGTYTYHATKKHAAVSAGTNTYTYDANGNMATRNGGSITWASYDLPTAINQTDGSYSQFLYGANRARYKQVAYTAATGVVTTIYVGDWLERHTRGTTTEYKHYIFAPNGPVAIHNRKSTGVNETVYLLKDHAGSVEMITNSAGNQMSRLSCGAFGARRNGGSWSGVPASSSWTTINNTTHRGFTEHEHLDNNLNLIHMNGRVYDPKIGRFMSADPFVQSPYFSQSLNRYSYTFNNPLSYTDPSGFQARSPDDIETPDGTPGFLPPPGTLLFVFWTGIMDEQSFAGAYSLTGAGEVGTNIDIPFPVPSSVDRPAQTPAGPAQPLPAADGGIAGSAGLAGGVSTNSGGNSTTPWQLGVQWLTGNGPRVQYFSDGDPLTQLLQQHSHIQDTRLLIANQIAIGGPLQGRNDYYVGGVDGVGKYLKDYSTLLTFGNTGNLAVTYLGSYRLDFSVSGALGDGTATVRFKVYNSSRISSATHPPIIGYTEWWERNIAAPLNSSFQTGPLSQTEQYIDWTETIRWRP